MRTIYIVICLTFFCGYPSTSSFAQAEGKAVTLEKESKKGVRGWFSKKKKLREENEDLKNESESLETQLEIEAKEKAKLESNLEEERNAQLYMERAMDYQSNALQSLTEEQTRTKLLLLSQQMLADSLRFASEMSKMKVTEQKLQLEQQNAKLEASRARTAELSSQKMLFIALAIFGAMAAFAFYNRLSNINKYNNLLEKKNAEVATEKKRAEDLLFNILPVSIANELTKNGSVIAKEYKDVTVMFTDFVNFTSIAEKRTPQELVEDLDTCFSAFDRIIQKYKLEKIKTIGDAYMVAGGIPEPSANNAKNMVKAAQEIQAFLAEWNQNRNKKNLPEFHARIGIHTGEVVAGVVGKRKFAFDIWGDCVNVAARLEQSCATDRINISAPTLAAVGNAFSFQARGKVMTKNKGEMEMYYLEG